MYNSYIMRRTQIYLDANQSEQLGRRARAGGVSKSTVIREAIASYLSSGDESDELARFLQPPVTQRWQDVAAT